MLLPHGTSIAVADGTKFEFFRNTGTEAEPKLTAQDTPELELTNFSAGAHRSDTSESFSARTGNGANDQLDESAHAIAVADWLNHQVLQHKIEKLVIIADPKSLGEMRKRYHKQLEGLLIKELAKTMTGRPVAEIVNALKG
ncbi:host attachment protein [Novosphingobium sp. 9U]|uniref:host attachment family protein n=1 Tax=Novosphingobium sp. 9U TaxID=2653158 RepID=UPI0012F0FACB|nr:host attachment protein [Novosphingobium sp. 9U]VWX54843.1 Attachment protein [Novosphingobium sp. 9U]